MKKIFKTILLSFVIVLAAALVFNLKLNQNFAFATSKTIFMVNPSMITSVSGETYVFDSSDKCLKLMQEDATQSSSYYVGDVIDIAAADNKIYLLKSDRISCFNTITKAAVTDVIVNIEEYGFSQISATYQDDKVILLTYSEENNKLYYYMQNSVSFDLYTIKISNSESSCSYAFIKCGDINYLMQTTNHSIVLHHPAIFGTNLNLSTTTTPELAEKTLDIMFANYTNGKLAITYETKTDIYDVTSESSYLSIAYKESVENAYDGETFECIDTSFFADDIMLLTKNGHYTLHLGETSEISNSIQNPVCTLVELEKDAYEYYVVKENSIIISTLGRAQSIAVPEGAYVVKTAEVSINSTSSLEGYKYVMYVNYYKDITEWKCQNIFGYISDEGTNLEQIEPTETSKTIKVLDNTQLYAYPSLEVDSNNVVLQNIGQHTPVELLLDLDEYTNGYDDGEQSQNNQFCLVQVGTKIGFISKHREMPEDKRIALVISNATVLADAIIYEEANSNAYAQTILKANEKVKIIGPRDRNGFVKIAYNDSFGNYYEGYITASYIRSNNFTTLQIVGAILVVINLFFLVILFVTRKKITK